jgi:hypothetical protein
MLEERRVLSTLTVTSNSDTAWGSTLRNEIAAAQPGDTIVFDPSLKGQIIWLGSGSQLEINKNLTIQGLGADLLTINGDGARVFKVDAGTNVAISGLTIEDGGGVASYYPATTPTTGTPSDYYDGYGGGILNLGTLILSGCNVTGNATGPSLGAGAYDFEGGGIYNGGTMTLSGCNVTSNSDGYGPPMGADAYGGGIYNGGTMTLSGCNVISNSLYTQGYSYGGGAYNHGTMTLSGCNVTGNSAGLAGTDYSKGGGIFNDTQGNLTILSSFLKNNTASEGGGIDNGGTTTLSGSSVTGNSASDGAGIDNGGWMQLSGCTVTGNTASSWGGGIYNGGTMTLNSNSTVTGNTAGQEGTNLSEGGGIFNDTQGSLTIASSVVQNNTASEGGGIYNDGTMTLSSSTVSGNSAGLAGKDFSKGGGIFNDTKGNLTILSSTVLNNTGSDGADICNLGSMKISKDSQVGQVSHK